MPKKKPTNPFYILLVIAGSAFAITAMAFGVMTVRDLQASRNADYFPVAIDPLTKVAESDSFNELVDRYGIKIMIGELVLLAIGTFGAIGYDQHLDRNELKSESQNANTEGESP